MQPFDLPTAESAGTPTVGLLPSLLFAAVGIAVLVAVIAKLTLESDDEPAGRDDSPSPPPEEPPPAVDEPADAEHTDEDVV